MTDTDTALTTSKEICEALTPEFAKVLASLHPDTTGETVAKGVILMLRSWLTASTGMTPYQAAQCVTAIAMGRLR